MSTFFITHDMRCGRSNKTTFISDKTADCFDKCLFNVLIFNR